MTRKMLIHMTISWGKCCLIHQSVVLEVWHFQFSIILAMKWTQKWFENVIFKKKKKNVDYMNDEHYNVIYRWLCANCTSPDCRIVLTSQNGSGKGFLRNVTNKLTLKHMNSIFENFEKFRSFNSLWSKHSNVIEKLGKFH